jgi:hypothetical protein
MFEFPRCPQGHLGAVLMIRSKLLIGALCALLMPALGCDMLDVTGTENASGRGAKAFDPYESSNSGAIRLSLQMYNGCASLPTGQVVPKNSAPMPGYPDTCEPLYAVEGVTLPQLPPGELRIIANTDYFLNQFTVTEVRTNLHTDASQLPQVVDWIKNQSRFKKLDWRNLGQVEDEWRFFAGTPGVTQDYWARRVLFDNANWRKVKDDKFVVEVMDAEGVVRETEEFFRSELLASSVNVGHTRFGWQLERVLPPTSPGDTTIRPLPEIEGYPPEPPVTRTVARLDLVGSTNPFKTLRIPDLRGEGAIRVTWSQMPDDPFYFPVTFVNRQDLPQSCFDNAGNPVQCGFGIDPNLRFISPNPDNIYKPGDTVNMFVDLRDDQGNRLHQKDLLPSGAEMVTNQANGLLSMVLPYVDKTGEVDMVPVVTVVGPLHKMKTRSSPYNKGENYFSDPEPFNFIPETATTTLAPAEFTQKWSTRTARKLPDNAEFGTYAALIKWNRFFAGERFVKIKPHFFQVGTDERTAYPGRVGNCQICHRGVLSLDNLRHGLSVDHVEACKTCHQYATERAQRIQSFIHRIHASSPRYPADRTDCTMCHLTRESATRPSLDVCSSCHPSVHGDEFFASRFNGQAEPNQFGNCAQSCHGDTPPLSHIIPEN